MRSILPNITTTNYPFGMLIKERSFSSGEYRFGFNGQEKDDEVCGAGNSYTAEFWQYDSRLGRRFNVDPVVKEYESPYACFANNPIWIIDPNGADTSFIDNQARNDFVGTMKELDSKIADNQSLIDELKAKSEKKGWDEKKYQKKLDKEGYARRLDALKEVRGVFDIIIKSEVMFEYSTTAGVDRFRPLQNGNTALWSDGKKVTIEFRAGHKESVVHENRHGLGVLLHEVGFNEAMDYQDEYEAFTHQRIFDEQSVYRDIQNSAKSAHPNNPDRWQSFDLMETIRHNYQSLPGYIRNFEQVKAKKSPYPLLTR